MTTHNERRFKKAELKMKLELLKDEYMRLRNEISAIEKNMEQIIEKAKTIDSELQSVCDELLIDEYEAVKDLEI